MAADVVVTTQAFGPRRLLRWGFAAAAFGAGVVYIAIAVALGVEFRLGGRDVTLAVGLATEAVFAAFGFLVGRTLERSQAERQAAATERAGLERLASMQTRLARSERLAAVGQIASRLAHEVRNPLAIIRSSVQNLAEGALSEASSRDCRLILEEIDRLARVISALGGLARPVPPRPGVVSAAELVARARWLGDRLLEGGSARLEVREGPAEAFVLADTDFVCQILLGLLTNAVEITPAGGAVHLEWRATTREVVFRVTDGGPGVPEGDRERVFEPFFTTKPGGTGLGLAVGREMAEAQGGTLALEPSRGGGAAFLLSLPRADAPASAP